MNKKIILISGRYWSLKYLKDCFSDKILKKTTLITDEITNNLKAFCLDKNVNLIKTNLLSPAKLKGLDIKNSIVLSAGTPWIYKKNIINILGKNFFNVHQSPLPSMRGSVASYIILYDIRSFQTCLHRVAPGIDTGNVIFRKSFIIPSSLRTPREINDFLHFKNREMVKHFLNTYNKIKLLDEKQNIYFSSYNKRLSSKINGWIDWSMNVDDLDRFIRAYGNPYGGANTFLSNSKIRIDEIEKSQNDSARHPEEVGTILRKFEDYIIVSVNNGSIYIKKVWKNKKNIINSLKAGDKFYTKKNYLDKKNQRALFIKQTKIWNKKIRLKKIN